MSLTPACVRAVQRLLSIAEEDLVREGGMWRETCSGWAAEHDLAGFGRWWDEVHSRPEARWEANPWVWVIEFERV